MEENVAFSVLFLSQSMYKKYESQEHGVLLCVVAGVAGSLCYQRKEERTIKITIEVSGMNGLLNRLVRW